MVDNIPKQDREVQLQTAYDSAYNKLEEKLGEQNKGFARPLVLLATLLYGTINRTMHAAEVDEDTFHKPNRHQIIEEELTSYAGMLIGPNDDIELDYLEEVGSLAFAAWGAQIKLEDPWI